MKSKLCIKKNDVYEQLFPQTTVDLVITETGDLAEELIKMNNSISKCELKSNKGIANGYASLGSDGKVLSSQLPAQVDISGKEDKSNRGIANGYASLGTNGKIPNEQLPLQFDFDNLASLSGNIKNTIFNTDGSVSETIKNTIDNKLVAIKNITFGTGVIYEDETVYKDDGATIIRKTRNEIKFNADGSITEKVVNL